MVEFGIPTEHEEQAALVSWAAAEADYLGEHSLRLLFAIPNGGFRSMKTAKALRAEGVRAGVPDLFLPCARGGWNGCFIEMKRTKGGSVSIAQANFHAELELQGFRVLVCRGAEEAKQKVLAYLRGK